MTKSRAEADILRAKLVEELDELRANIRYICEECENAENHPENMRKWLSTVQSLNSDCTSFFEDRFFKIGLDD